MCVFELGLCFALSFSLTIIVAQVADGSTHLRIEQQSLGLFAAAVCDQFVQRREHVLRYQTLAARFFIKRHKQ